MVDLTVGVAGPFSGPRACYGEILRKEIGRGLLPPRTIIIFADDRADPVRAAQVARRFIDRGVDVVVGHFNSDCAETAAALYAPAGIPLILPASTRPSLTGGPMVFRICPNDHDQTAAISHFMHEQGLERGAIWTDGSRYGMSLRDMLLDREDPRFETISGETSQFFARRVVIYLGAHHSVAAALARLRSRRPGLLAICCDDCSIREFAGLVGDAEGIWIVAPVPDFAGCVRRSLSLIANFCRMERGDIGAWLARPSGPFVGGENPEARFEVVPLAPRPVH
jgi:branched-chain amino acid transport system substrate-binding protein